jgi:UDP-N-acetylmuramoyl-L-alanyl-D-glutamate--2,6-diaminopimelate ligase
VGLRFRAATPEGEVEIASSLAGDYNIANILAAAGAALALGVPLAAIPAGVASLAGVPGRMEAVERGQAFRAVVDFAHTPQALEAVLTAGRREVAGAGGRVLVVFGCAGRRDPGKRAAMGRVAGRLADLTVLTAEDPRDEDLGAIIEQSAAGLREEGRVEGEGYFRRPDRFQAIRLACELAGPGDLVLVCGKGHEQSLCFGQIEYPWDDREALAAALTGGSYGHLPTSAGG